MPDKYPFDLLSEHARRALVCAQQEAEDAADGYIGTQHLLLGLLRVGAGSAFRALRALGIDEMKLRADIDRLQEHRPQIDVVPSMAVKHALEQAFQQSQGRGDAAVRTGDILAGIVQVEDSAGAKVLKRQWVEAGAVLAAVDRELRLT